MRNKGPPYYLQSLGLYLRVDTETSGTPREGRKNISRFLRTCLTWINTVESLLKTSFCIGRVSLVCAGTPHPPQPERIHSILTGDILANRHLSPVSSLSPSTGALAVLVLTRSWASVCLQWKKKNHILSGQIPNLLSWRIKIYFLCMQKRLGLVSLPRLFSLLTDHKLVIFVTLLQLLACHLHCLKSKQDHLNLQLQYFSFHTSPVMLESQLCMLFCQCARSRRETSLLFWNYTGSAVLTAGKNVGQVNRYDSGQIEFPFQSHFWLRSHTSPRDTSPRHAVQEHRTSTSHKLARFWCVSLSRRTAVGVSSTCTVPFPLAESLNFSGV